MKFLSPTSITLWHRDRQEFYLKYLAKNRPPKIPQTQPMAVGAAFDAYIKAHLFKHYIGGADPRFDFSTLFEAQVEPHNRDFAISAGAHVFAQYRASGALASLMLELADSQSVGLEMRLERQVMHGACVDGVPLVGVPDIYFYRSDNFFVYDWKINGFCSVGNTSPKPGYVRIFAGGRQGAAHKEAILRKWEGILINGTGTLDPDWARQLAIYAWILGAPVGSDFVVGIDQVVGKGGGSHPILRVACHRCRISRSFQEALYTDCVSIWSRIAAGLIFDDLSASENAQLCAALDTVGDSEDWFQSLREHSPW